MGAIKEFYHDEICAMQRGDDIVLDDEYMEAKWRKHEEDAADAALQDMDADLIEVEHSGVPKHLHSRF